MPISQEEIVEMRRQWWARWFEKDYSWDGLAKLNDEGTPDKPWIGWSVTPENLIVETDSAPEGSRPATLQDYFRWDADAKRLRNDEELTELNLLHDEHGHPRFHILHLPDKWLDDTPTWKIKPTHHLWDTLETEVGRLLARGAKTEFEGFKVNGHDNRAQFQGAVLQAFPRPDRQKRTEVSDSGDAAIEPAPLHVIFDDAAFLRNCEAEEAHFGSGASFIQAIFLGYSGFDGAQFSGGDARFGGAQFSGGVARFSGAQFFGGNASFDDAKFSGGDALFPSAQFSGGFTWFVDAEFSGGNAGFDGVQFSGGNARFIGAKFSGGDARFNSAQFSGGDTRFSGAEFSGGVVVFLGARFSGGDARFDGAEFSGGDVHFFDAQFSGGYARFDNAQFSGGEARFDGAQFSGGVAWFDSAQFSGGDAGFDGAEFSGGNAGFENTRFKAPLNAINAAFQVGASFRGAEFDEPVRFGDAQQSGPAKANLRIGAHFGGPTTCRFFPLHLS